MPNILKKVRLDSIFYRYFLHDIRYNNIITVHDPSYDTLRPQDPHPKSGGRDPNLPGLTPLVYFLQCLHLFPLSVQLLLLLSWSLMEEQRSSLLWLVQTLRHANLLLRTEYRRGTALHNGLIINLFMDVSVLFRRPLRKCGVPDVQ